MNSNTRFLCVLSLLNIDVESLKAEMLITQNVKSTDI